MFQYQSFGEVVAALRRRAPLLSFIILVGCAASVWAALQRDQIYETSGTLGIAEAGFAEPRPHAERRMSGLGGETAPSLRLIQKRLMDYGTIRELIEEYRLFPAERSMTERVFAMRQAVRIEALHEDPTASETDFGTKRLRVTVRLDDAQTAAAVANALMSRVNDGSWARNDGRDAEALSHLTSETERLSAQIEAQEAAIAAFKRENSSALPGGIGTLRERLVTFEESLLALDRKIIELEARSARAGGEGVERQVAQLRMQREEIEQRITEIQADLARAPEVERSLSGLERDLSQLQERYIVVTRHRAEAEMESVRRYSGASFEFEVLERAPVPERSISRGSPKIAFAGAGASVVLAIAVALFLAAFDPSIRTAGQMERRLGITPLVAIPPVRTRQDRRRIRFLQGGMIMALIASAYAAIKAFGGGVIEAALSWKQAEL